MSRFRMVGRIAAGLAATGLALGLATAPAAADPVGPPTYRDLAGAGSDTTQDVNNALAAAIQIGGSPVLGSYDARGSATVSPKADAHCQDIYRPNGSSDGRNALIASIQGVGYKGDPDISGCWDFARSSSAPPASELSPDGDLTYIPLALDGVGYATLSTSYLPGNLTVAELQKIYKCETTHFFGQPITPLLPQSGSGTRSFWLETMGITEAQLAAGDYPCIDQRGDTIQEHDGTALTGNGQIVPFSVAQYIAQGNSLPGVADRRGNAVLRNVNGVSATVTENGKVVANPAFPITRTVCTIVPTAAVTDPSHPKYQLINDVFVDDGTSGDTALVPHATGIIQDYGFALAPDAGDTSLRAYPNII